MIREMLGNWMGRLVILFMALSVALLIVFIYEEVAHPCVKESEETHLVWVFVGKGAVPMQMHECLERK